MGKQKKGFNWRAREQGGSVDTREVDRLKNKVSLAGVDHNSAAYEGSNALALPQNKLKFKKAEKKVVVGKILSKKQRKRLEKIVEMKKKKEERAGLLEALKSVQTTSLEGFESLASAQTKGVKRQAVERREGVRLMQTQATHTHQLTPRASKRRRGAVVKKEEKREDVLGFTSESSSEEEEEESSEAKSPPIVDVVEEESDKPDDTTVEDCSDKIAEADFKPKVAPNKDTADVVVEAPSSCKPQGLTPVFVNRPDTVVKSRSLLPIIAEEQVIMETINNHAVVVLSGETGSGKTTQLPQFLYEAGYTSRGQLIGVTEPRRVAATAMSHRVALELGVPQSVVSYQIRYEGNTGTDTRVKFMTDGVLLREVQQDFLLTKYSVIIIDEAHERSVFTDILIGLLSRIVPLRHKKKMPLKLVIMSATLRVEDFTSNTRLFKSPPPVVSVESRQFPVTVHFNKHTRDDYLSEAYRKVCKIHRELPEGGVLVFVTGQQEVNTLVRKLRQRFPGQLVTEGGHQGQAKVTEKTRKWTKKKPSESEGPMVLPEIDLSKYKIQPLDDTETDVMEEDEEEDEALGLEDPEDDSEGVGRCGVSPLHVLPLYSLLSSERQAEIWAGAPQGSRLCVVATNVAETSLTIPGVKYVVDCGKVKVKHWDKVTGVTTFLVEWTSKAQANQRAGRAGRQGAGHAYRLYSSAVFNNDMKEFSVPEIQQRPVDDLLLQMKAMNIDKVVNFPFPTCPDITQLRQAESRLQMLGALQSPPPGLSLKEADKVRFLSSVTPLGRCIAAFPLSPRFGKMLALAHQHGLLGLSVSLVACLAVQEVLVERGLAGEGDRRPAKEVMALRRRWAGQGHSLKLGDSLVLLKALTAAERNGYCGEFCSSVGLRPKAVLEIRRLRRQLVAEVERLLPGELGAEERLQEPTEAQARLLAQLLLAGSPNLVARRVPAEEGGEKGSYRTGAMQQVAFIHQSSVLKRTAPEWLVYQEIFEAEDGKIVMRGITEICPSWLPIFCPGLCRLGNVLETPSPRYCVSSGRVMATFKATFGPQAWPLPATEHELAAGLERYKWLGRFVLEGVLAPALKQFTSSLLSNPLIMSKSWSNLQKRTELIVNELSSRGVESGKKLEEIWQRDKFFLLKAYLAWLPEVLHDDVTKLWPPAVVTDS